MKEKKVDISGRNAERMWRGKRGGGGHASPSILESAHTFAFLILNFMYLFSFPEIGIM